MLRVVPPQDLKVIHEDEHIIVVDKPHGTLCVPSEDGIPSLAQSVFEKCSADGSLGLARMDQMVVHRLGMETSGLVVFAKTIEAVLLHYIDEIDSKVNAIREFIAAQDTEENWTSYHRLLERHFYKGKRLRD